MVNRLCALIGPTFLAAVLVLSSGCNLERNESIQVMNEGIELYKKGHTELALERLDKATKTDPTNAQAWFYWGMVSYRGGTTSPEAVAHLRKAIELDGDNFEYHYHLGSALAQQGDWVGSINAFEMAIQRKPDHAESHYRLGQALEQQAKFDRAQEAYQSAIKLKPHFPEAYNALGNLYVRFEKYPQAIQVFKNAIENNPNAAENYQDLGVVYQAQKRYDEAIKQFEAAIKLKPTLSAAVFNLAMAYAANDDKQAAVDHLKRYLASRPPAEDPLRVQTAQETLARLEAPPSVGDQMPGAPGSSGSPR
jgi:superkiller protein 3